MHKNIFYEQDKFNREIKSVDNVFANFLVEKGLFEEIEITKDNVYELADLIGGHVKINVFCPRCGENRVFSCEPVYKYLVEGYESRGGSIEEEIIAWQHIQNVQRNLEEADDSWSWFNQVIAYDTRLMVFRFYCAMDCSHRLDYIVITEDNKMKKIGQFPSVADLSFPKLKEYRKVMPSKDDERELKRAIGLYSNGIGVGSYVYLRRIFERLIFTVSKTAIEEGKLSADVYTKANHLDEKVRLLESYLPKALVANPVFYGIISKGIHELSEEECIEYFPVLQSFIMLVLKQWEAMRQEEEEEKKLTSNLNSIASKIKNN